MARLLPLDRDNEIFLDINVVQVIFSPIIAIYLTSFNPQLCVIRLYQFNCWAGVRVCIAGRSPGLVVMGGDSHSKGRGFESRCRILDGHDIFSH